MIPHESITSPANERVRRTARLRDASARRETGLTLVDGRRELARAAAAGVEIPEVFVAAALVGPRPTAGGAGDERPGHASAVPDDLLVTLAARGTRITALAERPFAKVAFGDRDEGVVGVVRMPTATLARLACRPDRPVLVIEGVEKPGNLGAILRTADAAGLAAVIVCDGRTDPANPAVIRASLGTVFSVPLAVTTTAEAIDWCRGHGRRVVAATPAGARPWHEARLAGEVALVLGSEAHGLSPRWAEAAGRGLPLETVRLPMCGAADSLNLSATAAVLAYESLRQAAARTDGGAAGSPPHQPRNEGPQDVQRTGR